jgi:hypothetical protein
MRGRLLSPGEAERERPGEGGAEFEIGAPLHPITPAGVEDRKADAIAVGKDVDVPEPENAQAAPLEIGRAAGVIVGGFRVLAAIHLDGQRRIERQKIQDVGPERDLAFPLPTAQAACPQRISEMRFRACGLPAHPAGANGL